MTRRHPHKTPCFHAGESAVAASGAGFGTGFRAPRPARDADSPGMDRTRNPVKPHVYRHADHPGVTRPEGVRDRERSHPSRY